MPGADQSGHEWIFCCERRSDDEPIRTSVAPAADAALTRQRPYDQSLCACFRRRRGAGSLVEAGNSDLHGFSDDGRELQKYQELSNTMQSFGVCTEFIEALTTSS